MKKNWLLLVFIMFFISVSAQEEIVKTGWNFGTLPTVTFDTDLGFQYGALVDLYHYGNGIRYPVYDHKFYFEFSRYTKGSGINRFYYDSDRLLEGIQTSVDLSYLSDQAYDFYGFNGYEAVVNSNRIDNNRMFYKYDRKMFRFRIDLLGSFYGENLKWAAGINLLNFKVGSVDIERLNKGKSGDDLLPDEDGLYDHYRDWGIISVDEADGGFIPELKTGLIYDSRDNRPNPMRGIWTEAVVAGVPEFLGAESGFAKLSIIHRQYFTIIPEDLSLAYRLAWQSTIAGDAPFYYQTQIIVSEMREVTAEGLGGAKTLRGIRRNRIVGDGIFYGNVEARWKVVRFQFLKNNFYLGLNGFTDFGKVIQRIELNSILAQLPEEHFNLSAEKMHFSYGSGLRLSMNQNFNIAIDYGMAADKRDGDSGLYIGLNYLF
jgi:hypothetical protein